MIVLLGLAALAGSITYAGYLVVGVVSGYLGISRFLTGLLLGLVFARLPYVRQGKLGTIGFLPKNARLPLTLFLLAFCMLSFVYRGQVVPVLFLGLATTFLLTYRRLRQMLVRRVFASVFNPPPDATRPERTDNTVIDVEFREKKD